MVTSTPSHRLTFEEAVEVWTLRRQGWFQHRIAAHFDVNSARINDVLKERTFVGSRQVADNDNNDGGDLFSRI